ncbi:MAG: hypothetical protein RL117_550 [Verrucomicrobiota bacterium]|jgi:ankyrin repeat protein
MDEAYNQWVDIVRRTKGRFNAIGDIDPNAMFPDSQTTLHLAAQFDYVELAEWLISNNADIDPKDIEGYTPLLHAAVFLSYSVIKLLLARGADPKLCTNSGLDLADLLRIGVEFRISSSVGVQKS